MPRVARVDDALPDDVEAAVQAVSSRLRIGVLHELARGPRTTTELMTALGVADRTTMTENLRDLETLGVLSGNPDFARRPGRTTTWTADRDQVAALAGALTRHLTSRRRARRTPSPAPSGRST